MGVNFVGPNHYSKMDPKEVWFGWDPRLSEVLYTVASAAKLNITIDEQS